MTWAHTRWLTSFVLSLAWCLIAAPAWAAGMHFGAGHVVFPRAEKSRPVVAPEDGTAQFEMGNFLYARGDFTNAVKWYELAAEQEHRGAQLSLAACYLLGRGVNKDLERAARWAAGAPDKPAAADEPAGPVLPDETRPSVPHGHQGLEQAIPELEPVRLILRRYGEEDLRLAP
jgi:hypothetical protein